jgi:response regulator NasT
MGMMDSAELAYVIEEDRLAPVIMITPGDHFKTHGQNGEPKPFAYIIEPVTERNLLPIIDVVIKNFKRIRNLEQEIDILKRAIETRKLVEKAKGILMDTYKISEAEAFRRIQKQSMNKRISMKSVAKAIILTHEINR